MLLPTFSPRCGSLLSFICSDLKFSEFFTSWLVNASYFSKQSVFSLCVHSMIQGQIKTMKMLLLVNMYFI